MRHRVLKDFTSRQQTLLIRATVRGVELDDPVATPGRVRRLEALGLIHLCQTRKGRKVWRTTDAGRGLVGAHTPDFLNVRWVPPYTHQPWVSGGRRAGGHRMMSNATTAGKRA